MTIWIVAALAIAAAAYVRLAPGDPAIWHQPPPASADPAMRNGVVRTIAAGADGLERLDRIMTQTPRTRVLAGSVAAGMITYVTRSRLFGFPDYTTVARQDDDALRIFARARFGRSDLGVNGRRVDAWLVALQAGG